ncbi:WhiB family transcriptional regulator [Streptomyces sp. V2]|uniref:WhiB family transcriptional regulator n=1 Tax=Streptomyces sp. V2 TaxID=1424099 RepID=UPI000D670E55|nr:WhiB family transcriptional regulator [Streptomyces sp. V2]
MTHAATVPDTAERPGAWKNSAVCAGVDPELFFPTQGDSRGAEDARTVCASCPVRLDCLEDALQAETGRGLHSRHGIYGGLNPRQRYRLHLTRTGQKAAA